MQLLVFEKDLFSSELYAKISEIRRLIPEPALYEQMAEECAELGQALLKKARKIRDENYTPKNFSEIDNNLIEEFTDVFLCSLVLSLYFDDHILTEKLDRWIFRNSTGKQFQADGDSYENS